MASICVEGWWSAARETLTIGVQRYVFQRLAQQSGAEVCLACLLLPPLCGAWETAGQSCLNLEVPFAFGSTDCSGVQAVRCLAYVDAGYGLAGGSCRVLKRQRSVTVTHCAQTCCLERCNISSVILRCRQNGVSELSARLLWVETVTPIEARNF